MTLPIYVNWLATGPFTQRPFRVQRTESPHIRYILKQHSNAAATQRILIVKNRAPLIGCAGLYFERRESTRYANVCVVVQSDASVVCHQAKMWGTENNESGDTCEEETRRRIGNA